MAKFKIDLLMNLQKHGWSETYWREAADVNSAGTIALNLATVRTPLCSIVTRVDGWRITPYDDSGLRNGRGLVQDATPFGIQGAQPAARDQEDVAVLVKMSDGTNNYRKNLWLRGLPDSSTEFFLNGNPNFTPAFNNVFQAFANYIKGNSFLIRTFDLTDANPAIEILQLQFAETTGQLRLLLSAPLVGGVAGKRLKISGYRGPFSSRVNGLTKITAVETGNAYVTDRYSCEFKGQSGSGNGARARIEKYLFPGIVNMAAQRFTSHQTGRAFFVAPGRRLVKGRCLVTRAATPSIG